MDNYKILRRVFVMLTRRKKIMSLFLMLLFFSLSVSLQAFAAPNITGVSGSFGHDSTVTITGTGFGTKISGKAVPIRFDDFEDGKLGDYVEAAVGEGSHAGSGWWSRQSMAQTAGGMSYASFDNKAVLGRGSVATRGNFSAKHIRWHAMGYSQGGQGNGPFYARNIPFATTGKLYVNLWSFYEDITPGQLKWIYLVPNATHEGRPGFMANIYTNSNLIYLIANSSYLQPPRSNPEDLPKRGYWINVAMQFKLAANGEAHACYSRTPPYQNMRYYKGSATGINLASSTNPIDSVTLGYYITTYMSEANTYWDDIYVDNSWARIEAGNAATYDACSHREIQIPSAWSTNSITMTVKQGSFAAGEQVYLFVVDEAGTASPGYGPITFTSTKGSPPPAGSTPTTPADLKGTLVP